MRYELGQFTDQGAREEQQDAAGLIDESEPVAKQGGVLAVVSDGMGGMRHGQAAAQLVVTAVLESYRERDPSLSIPEALQIALYAANNAVLHKAGQANAKGSMGATVVAAAVHDRHLYWISAGDSRAYLIRDGHTFRLTRDHNYGEDMRFTAQDASNAPPEAVTSFMGLPGRFKTDANLSPVPVQPGDCILLATDGLHQTLDEAGFGLVHGDTVRERCRNLVRSALARDMPDQDNVTVAMIRIGGAPGLLARISRRHRA